MKTSDNPQGVDGQVFEGIKAAIISDRYAYFGDVLDNFYNTDTFAPDRIGNRAWLVPIDGCPHNVGWTHSDDVNTALLEFLAG